MTTEETEDNPQGEQEPGETPTETSQGLPEIIEKARASRLPSAMEDRAVNLLKEAITGGPEAQAGALEALLALPWSIGVRAVTEAWPGLEPEGRGGLIAGLAGIDTEVSRRIRLSLARALHPQDAESALGLVTSVCEAMGGAGGGSTTKDRQIFASVLLGKAKPWLMNISMAEMTPGQALTIMTPALESCGLAPIFTQIWVLRWICDAEKFDALPPEHIESIAKSINRWQPRWRKELRKIISKLPESLEAALGGSTVAAPAAIQPEGEAAAEEPDTDEEGESDHDTEDEEDEEEDEEEDVAPEPRPGRRSRRERQQGGTFDLGRTLREIETYVARLRSELQQAQVAARRREPGAGRQRGRPAEPVEDMDELRRYNQQLEEQNEELRRRFEELASDHEDRAAIIEISDTLEQFKTLLGLKLKEDFADYTAIGRESPSEVVRRHALEVLGRVFAVLEAEGVKFKDQG